MNKCLQCSKEIIGRTDKKFCSVTCKNEYNNKLRKLTIKETALIDSYLHRNREILMTIIGSAKQVQLDKLVLIRAKFRFEYHTGHYMNKEGKTYWLVYDFAWMDFSDQKILIVRKTIWLSSINFNVMFWLYAKDPVMYFNNSFQNTGSINLNLGTFYFNLFSI